TQPRSNGQRGGTTIEEIAPGGPMDKAGIRPGANIIKINNIYSWYLGALNLDLSKYAFGTLVEVRYQTNGSGGYQKALVTLD
ncbi:hypothetical protein BG000_004575, partial [Podila horticola]